MLAGSIQADFKLDALKEGETAWVYPGDIVLLRSGFVLLGWTTFTSKMFGLNSLKLVRTKNGVELSEEAFDHLVKEWRPAEYVDLDKRVDCGVPVAIPGNRTREDFGLPYEERIGFFWRLPDEKVFMHAAL